MCVNIILIVLTKKGHKKVHNEKFIVNSVERDGQVSKRTIFQIVIEL